MLAATAPSLPGALPAAQAAGHTHLHMEGTLMHTTRCRTPGPTAGVDLWWSGKHHRHGGNIQVVTAPDGWPLWVSAVRPGREHHTTCPVNAPTAGKLTANQRTINALLCATRALAERGNSLLKTTFKALQRVSLCPWRIGAIAVAALVLLHCEHHRAT